MKIVKVSSLKVGDTFSFIPEPWYGRETVEMISKRDISRIVGYWPLKYKTFYEFDLKCSANVVNPPAVTYGVPGETKVILYPKERKCLKNTQSKSVK